MANLETLELTINANAEGADRGIDRLIGSLSKLSDALVKPFSDLADLNREIEKLKNIRSIKIPDFGSTAAGGPKSPARAMGAVAAFNGMKGYEGYKPAVASIIPEFKKGLEKTDPIWASWMYGPRQKPVTVNNLGPNSMMSEEERRTAHPEWYRSEEEFAAIVRQQQMAFARAQRGQGISGSANAATNAAENASSHRTLAESAREATQAVQEETAAVRDNTAALSENAGAVNEMAQPLQQVENESEGATTAMHQTAEAASEAAEEAEEAARGPFTNLLDTISRIARTMMIRNAIKAFIKGFSEAWKAAYNFSKKMGGTFAKSVDACKASVNSIAVNLVRAFAPLVGVILPVINTIAAGVQYLSECIIQLLKLLGVVSDLFGATAQNIAEVGSASSGASKDILAGFDELNVISNSGGGGSNNSGANFQAMIGEELASIKILIAESLLAVGLILAFTGHVGVGCALAAVGAATIVGTIANDWGTLADDVKADILNIMSVAGASMLAVGLIIALAAPMHRGLGIALMAAGVANLATAVGLSWNMSDDVKAELAKIMIAVGDASMAIGAILALAVPGQRGLGIALMAIGAASMASAVALTWGLDTEVQAELAKITTVVSGASFAVGAVLALAVPGYRGLGLALMALGAANMVTAATLSWNLNDKMKAEVTELMEIVGGALLGVGAILALTGVATPLGIAMMAAGGVSLATAAALNWDSLTKKVISAFEDIKTGIVGCWTVVQQAVDAAWDSVKKWSKAKWNDFEAAWSGVGTGFQLLWGTIAESVSSAWKPVGDWLSAKWGDFKTGWENIKTKFNEIWTGIAGNVTTAWGKVKTWAETTWDKFSSWDKIKTSFGEIWDSIKSAVSGAWDKVSTWVTTGWGKFQVGWEKIKTNFVDIWDTVKSAVANAWDKVAVWVTTAWGKFQVGWENIKKNLIDVWDGIKKAVAAAWDKVSVWVTSTWGKFQVAWEAVKKGFVEVWNAIKDAVSDAWGKVTKWVSASWDRFSRAWDEIKKGFVDIWNAVKDAVVSAWEKVSTWVTTGWGKFQVGWEKIKKGFADIWDAVKESVSDAWNSVKDWVGAKWVDFKEAWTNIQVKFQTIWNSIKNVVGNAWDKVKEWTSASWGIFKDAWTNIQVKFQTVWNSIRNVVGNAWDKVKTWTGAKWTDFKSAWTNIQTKFQTIWNSIRNVVGNAWGKVETWIGAKWDKFKGSWTTIQVKLQTIWNSIKNCVGNAWNSVSEWWDTDIKAKIEAAWKGVKDWFKESVTDPIKEAFESAIATVKSWINVVIKGLNDLGSFRIPKIEFTVFGQTITVFDGRDVKLWNIPELKAEGGFVDTGKLFIAGEAGPELVGTMDGKTTVANQEQIIEGIRRGVSDANSEQNTLLRQQNELLLKILQKDGSLKPTSSLGRIVSQSLDMYSAIAGV